MVGVSGEAVDREGVGGEGGNGAGGGGGSASALRLRGNFSGCAASGSLAAGGWCGGAHWMKRAAGCAPGKGARYGEGGGRMPG